MKAWHAAVARFHAAIEAAYPPGFFDAFQRIRSGDRGAVDPVLSFLEADPYFSRSGCVKASLIRAVKKVTFTSAQRERAQRIVLAVIDSGDRPRFRSYCQLARVIDGPLLRAGLTARLTSEDNGVRRRAGWVLAALHP